MIKKELVINKRTNIYVLQLTFVWGCVSLTKTVVFPVGNKIVVFCGHLIIGLRIGRTAKYGTRIDPDGNGSMIRPPWLWISPAFACFFPDMANELLRSLGIAFSWIPEIVSAQCKTFADHCWLVPHVACEGPPGEYPRGQCTTQTWPGLDLADTQCGGETVPTIGTGNGKQFGGGDWFATGAAGIRTGFWGLFNSGSKVGGCCGIEGRCCCGIETWGCCGIEARGCSISGSEIIGGSGATACAKEKNHLVKILLK